jgi:hypothetical protein
MFWHVGQEMIFPEATFTVLENPAANFLYIVEFSGVNGSADR